VQKYHTVGTVPNSNIKKCSSRVKMDTYTWPLTALGWYGNFNKSGGIKL